MKEQKEKLLEFYREYLEWALEDGVDNVNFQGNCGLCGILTYWKSLTYDDINDNLDLKDIMCKRFTDAGLCPAYPFSSEDVYYMECATWTIHKNADRLNWIRNDIKALEKEIAEDDE